MNQTTATDRLPPLAAAAARNILFAAEQRNMAAGSAAMKLRDAREHLLVESEKLAKAEGALTQLKARGARVTDEDWQRQQVETLTATVGRARSDVDFLMKQLAEYGVPEGERYLPTRMEVFAEFLISGVDTHRGTNLGSDAREQMVRRPLADAQPTPAPALSMGETFLAAQRRLQDQRQALLVEYRRAEAAPLPRAVVKAAARQQIAALAAAGAPDVGGAIKAGKPVQFPRVALAVPYQAFVVPADNALATIMWLCRDEVIAKLEAQIDATADDANALAPDKRVARLDEVDRAILAIERDEEALIKSAAASGQRLARRADVDLRAVLQLAAPWDDDPTARAEPTVETPRGPRRSSGVVAKAMVAA